VPATLLRLPLRTAAQAAASPISSSRADDLPALQAALLEFCLQAGHSMLFMSSLQSVQASLHSQDAPASAAAAETAAGGSSGAAGAPQHDQQQQQQARFSTQCLLQVTLDVTDPQQQRGLTTPEQAAPKDSSGGKVFGFLFKAPKQQRPRLRLVPMRLALQHGPRHQLAMRSYMVSFSQEAAAAVAVCTAVDGLVQLLPAAGLFTPLPVLPGTRAAAPAGGAAAPEQRSCLASQAFLVCAQLGLAHRQLQALERGGGPEPSSPGAPQQPRSPPAAGAAPAVQSHAHSTPGSVQLAAAVLAAQLGPQDRRLLDAVATAWEDLLLWILNGQLSRPLMHSLYELMPDLLAAAAAQDAHAAYAFRQMYGAVARQQVWRLHNGQLAGLQDGCFLEAAGQGEQQQAAPPGPHAVPAAPAAGPGSRAATPGTDMDSLPDLEPGSDGEEQGRVGAASPATPAPAPPAPAAAAGERAAAWAGPGPAATAFIQRHIPLFKVGAGLGAASYHERCPQRWPQCSPPHTPLSPLAPSECLLLERSAGAC
jgi:hypothetical protein